jgi:putative membrane-bound dehydrogenase-like protein
MTRCSFLTLLAFAGLNGGNIRAADALAPAEAIKSFALADRALGVELVASEPMVESPCALAFDENGHLYVAENRGYPSTASPPQGRIALLGDKDGDGRMDERVTFAEGLTYPNGVLPWRGGVIVTCAPDVLFLKDRDGDGRADEKRVLLTGFATTGSTQLRVNAPTLGPDGWIYLAAGLSGGTITAPDHPERPPLKMTADVRFNPDTLEVEQVDGRSQYGMTFDDFGRRFICMNRLPVQHVVLASRWLRRNPNLAFSETVQDCHEREVKTGLRGGGDGVRLHPISSNITTADSHAGSFSAACGVFVWRGGSLGPSYGGRIFSCDPTGNLVHVDQLRPNGATFTAAPMFGDREFLASRDDWFRPVYLASGPDGALYVADMYRLVIEHPDYLPQEVRKHTDFETGKTMGRIWRVRGSGTKHRVSRALGASREQRVAALRSEDGWSRQTAFRLLRESPPEPAELRAELGKSEVVSQVALLHLLAALGQLNAEALQMGANAPDPRSREAALSVWLEQKAPRSWQPDPAVWGNESDPRARFVAALALGEIPEGTAALAAIAAENASDRWARPAVLSSISGRAKEFLEALLEMRLKADAGTLELLRGVGRNFENVAALREVVGKHRSGPNGGGEELNRITWALLLGASERSGARLENADGDPWLAAVLNACAEAATRPGRALEERALCIQLLGRIPWLQAGAPLLKLAREENEESLKTAAIRAAASFPEPEVLRALLAPGEWGRATPVQRELLLDALLSRGLHTAGVLDAIEEGRLPANGIPANRRGVLLKQTDKALRERAEAIFGKVVGDRQAAFESSKAALTLTAKPSHGRELFQQICATCHRLDRFGYAVGPDLLDIRNQPKENILFHIVVPDAEVAPAFAAYIAETKDGRTISGVLASETSTSITLRGPLAQDSNLLRSELKSLQALPTSLMPAGLEQAMTMQDLADLVAYLKGE